jgi:uncharacterized protein (DUF302 family)
MSKTEVTTPSFGIHAVVAGPFDAVRGRVVEALKVEGFGVLTEIDIQGTLKKKLDVDFRRYTILGACNPPFAHRALLADLDVGLMLPCNVVVYEQDDGRIHVAAVDPIATIAAHRSADLQEIARDVHDRLSRVVASVAASGA